MRKAVIGAIGVMLVASSALAQSSWRDDDDRRGWREDRREWSRDRDDRDRDGMRGHAMHHQDDGDRSRAARFFVRSGETRMAVRCDDRESMRACVDAALTLFDRVRTSQGGAASTPSGTPTPPSAR